jgi:DNA invertase Pin-like site-specific DNA recombinase
MAAAKKAQQGPLRVLGYVRVSTDAQASSGAGLAAQREAIKRECDYRGRELVDIIEEHNGQSAKTLERPGMQLALTKLAAGDADILMASKLDRISRSVVDFGTVIERARRDGWALVVLDSDIDMSTAAGKMVANVLVTFAEYERDLIGERTKAALAQKGTHGPWTSRRGREVTGLGRPVKVEDDLVDGIVQDANNGLTLRSIADRLNAEGVKTAHGAEHWVPETVRKVLMRAERQGKVVKRRVKREVKRRPGGRQSPP